MENVAACVMFVNFDDLIMYNLYSINSRLLNSTLSPCHKKIAPLPQNNQVILLVKWLVIKIFRNLSYLPTSQQNWQEIRFAINS